MATSAPSLPAQTRASPGREKRLLACYESVRPAAFVLPALALVIVFLVWPLAWIVGMSFTTWDGLSSPIRWAGLATWSSLASDPTFQASLLHTLLWMGLAATVPTCAGFGLAVLFARGGTMGGLGRAVAIVPLLLPPAVVATLWAILYNPSYGPIDLSLQNLGIGQPDWIASVHLAFWGLAIIGLWSCVGLSLLIFSAAIRSIDADYFDLARSEGAGFGRQVLNVIAPACVRSTGLAVIVTVVLTSQVYDLVYVLSGAGLPPNSTIMIPFDMFQRAFLTHNVSQAAAEAAVQVGLGLVLSGIALGLTRQRSEGMAGNRGYRWSRPSTWAVLLSAVVALIVALPLLWDVMEALTTGRATAINPMSLQWPPSLNAFAAAWNSGIGSGLGQSLLLAAIVVTLTLLLAFPAAFQLTSRGFPAFARIGILVILVVTLLQPGEAYVIPLFYLLLQLGLGNSITGVILAEVARVLPFTILLLWIFMRAIPNDLRSAGEIDAGGGLNLLTRVVAPVAGPAAAAAALWIFVTSWSEYTLPTILLSNSSWQTAPQALRAFAGTHDTQFNLLAAGTLLLVLPVVIVLVLAYVPAGRGLRQAERALTT